jgi:hypothetical protein
MTKKDWNYQRLNPELGEQIYKQPTQLYAFTPIEMSSPEDYKKPKRFYRSQYSSLISGYYN